MVKAIIAKSLIKIGKMCASAQVNSNCTWIHYQPKEPKALINRRKEKGKQ